jgi:hypothetical protein
LIRCLAIALAIGVFAHQAQAQQQSRATLLRSATTAYDEFQPERALDFAKAALDPSLGPADTAWTRGVHLLAQILLENNNANLARTWARWATRTSPGLAIDTVNFIAGVVTALREARAVTSTRSPGDAQTQTTWRWAARGSTEANGRIVISQGTMPVPISARVVGGALIPAGAQGLSLLPGTYEIEAAAAGYLPARVTREVLPGVTTTLTMSLTSLVAVTLPDNVRQRMVANLVPFTVHRFGTSATCSAGITVGRDLVVTTYQAVRGADSIAATVAGAPRFTVASYDVASDVAVLRASTPRTDSLPLATTLTEGLAIWGVRLTDCRTASDVRTRVAQATTATSTVLALGDTLSDLPIGSPFVDREGRVAGLSNGGAATALPATRLLALLDSARRNPTRSTSLAEVGRRENHLYGSMALSADVVGTTLRIAPIETWQWASLATTGTAPMTFVGPMGRYRVQASTASGLRTEQFITIRPDVLSRTTISYPRGVAAGPEAIIPPVAGKKRSKMPWILAGAGGVGVAAALALAGGGGPPKDDGTVIVPPTKGTITVQVPINPP